jgi:hypothetical protein
MLSVMGGGQDRAVRRAVPMSALGVSPVRPSHERPTQVYGRYAPGASPWWGIPINAKVAWVFQVRRMRHLRVMLRHSVRARPPWRFRAGACVHTTRLPAIRRACKYVFVWKHLPPAGVCRQEIPCVIIAWSNMASGKPECLESTVHQILYVPPPPPYLYAHTRRVP